MRARTIPWVLTVAVILLILGWIIYRLVPTTYTTSVLLIPPSPLSTPHKVLAITTQFPAMPCDGKSWPNQVVAPSIIRKAVPEYPRVTDAHSGTSIVAVKVALSGKPEHIGLLDGSSYAYLDKSALAAAKRTTFKPGTLNGKPVDMWCRLTYVFSVQ